MTRLFTIIIPTVNREKEFKSALNTVLAEKYAALEIIVKANGVSWNIQKYIADLNDGRIVLRRHLKQVSMAENWSDGIDQAQGEFIFVLGDDDGWYAGSLQIINNLLSSNEGVNVITWRRDDFGWPDAVACIRNRLHLSYEKTFNLIESRVLLRKIFSDELSHEYLPKIYSSFIRKTVIQKFKDTYGSYFVDPSNPDMSTGVQVLAHEARILRSELPFSVIGTSGTSNGASSALLGHGITQNDVSPEHEFLPIWGMGAGPELAILNCFARAKRIMALNSVSLKYSTRIIRYILDLPPTSRVAALKFFLSESRLNVFTDVEKEKLLEIKSKNFEIPQPVTMEGTIENLITKGEKGAFGARIYTPSIGVDSIERAVNFSLLLRSLRA